MVCEELAWPSPRMIDETPCGARCSQPSLVLVCWSLFHSLRWLGLLHGHVGLDFSCGFFGADVLVRIFGCGFFSRIFEVRLFFADFVMACADFGVRIFSADFFGYSPAEKTLQKSHQKIPPKNPHQRFSPRNVSSQYTTTLLLAKHSRSPQGVWVQMHLVENRFLCADGVCQGG